MSQTLYRLFDRDWRLLYIGISMSAAERFAQHRADKNWWPEVEHITMRSFPDRDSVLLAEKQAIQQEHPRYNVIHNHTLTARPPLVTTGPGCTVCKEPVLNGTGTIELHAREFMFSDRAWTLWHESYDRRRHAALADRMLRGSELVESLTVEQWYEKHSHDWPEPPLPKRRPPLVPWIAVHFGCDVGGSGGPYWLNVENIDTQDKAIDWTIHLGGKEWFSRTNWSSLLRRLQAAHGWGVPSLDRTTCMAARSGVHLSAQVRESV